MKNKKRKRLLILYTASTYLNWVIFSGKVIGMRISILKNSHNFDPVTLFLGIYSQKIIINVTKAYG